MYVAEKKDRDLVINILYKAYMENPSFRWIIKYKTEEQYKKKLKYFCGYFFDLIQPLGGVYITSYNEGVAMIFRNGIRKTSLKTWILDILVAINVIGIKKGLEMMEREKVVKKIRPDGDYLYFWMLASDPDAIGFKNMAEMRDETFAMSEDIGLPIYAETTVEHNVPFYKRYGFREYDSWENPDKGFTIHFMKREVGAKQKQKQNI